MYKISDQDNDYFQNFNLVMIKENNFSKLIDELGTSLKSKYIINTNQVRLNQKPNQNWLLNNFDKLS